jgi:hypothetical protein
VAWKSDGSVSGANTRASSAGASAFFLPANRRGVPRGNFIIIRRESPTKSHITIFTRIRLRESTLMENNTHVHTKD